MSTTQDEPQGPWLATAPIVPLIDDLLAHLDGLRKIVRIRAERYERRQAEAEARGGTRNGADILNARTQVASWRDTDLGLEHATGLLADIRDAYLFQHETDEPEKDESPE